MIQPINWQWYIAASVVLLAVYYVSVILLYYRKNKKPATQRTEHPDPLQPTLFAQPNLAASGIQPTEPDLSDTVYDFVDELRALLLQSAADQAEKDGLYGGISRLLQKYPKLKGSAFQSAITNLIAMEAENQCAVHFTAEELALLWR
jgi:heme/copper-type cytochrome/quinol oxidase subunit 2